MNNQLSEWDQAIEYGEHLVGMLPDGTVTGLLVHDGNWFKSYMEGPEHTRYPRWERDHDQTPLGDALESFAVDGGGAILTLEECYYNGTYYDTEDLVGGVLTGWEYEYERKRKFKKYILRGKIEIDAPVLFNRFGNIWTTEAFSNQLETKYWKFIEGRYEHKMSYQKATKNSS